MFRINYGNGQVSNTFTTYAAARRELLSLRELAHSEGFRIQRYAGCGEWVGLGKDGRLATLNREGLLAENTTNAGA